MKDKITIVRDKKHHLYSEPYDEDRVYLEIINPEFETVDNFYGELHERKLILTIPSNFWDKAVNKSQNSEDD